MLYKTPKMEGTCMCVSCNTYAVINLPEEKDFRMIEKIIQEYPSKSHLRPGILLKE